MAACVRTGNWKLTYWQSLNTGELYDLKKDPGECTNLWDTAPSKNAQCEMMQQFVARIIASTDPMGVHVF